MKTIKNYQRIKLKIYNKNLITCGCDEAGRGSLAGPVFASAVVFQKIFHPLLNDSKLINEKTRYKLRSIIEKNAISWSIAKVSPKKIDKNKTYLMHQLKQCIKQLKINTEIDMLLIDGNKFKPFKNINHKCIIKGDAKFISIASASILAKTYRDDYMRKLSKKNPIYNWEMNKGYPTKEHKEK